MRTLTAFVLSLSISCSVFAKHDSHTQAALALLELTNSQQLADGMVVEMKQLIDEIPHGDLSVTQQQLFASFQQKMRALIDATLSWSALKVEYAQVYMATYSEQELKALTHFYQTPLGKKVLASTTTINEALITIPQTHVDTLMTQMHAEAQAVMQNINDEK